MKTILQATDVTKSFKSKQVLNGVSFELRAGEIHALLGHNGAGKTTFVKILANLLERSSGDVLYYGKSINSYGRSYCYNIGYVGQDTERSAYGRLTVRENLYYFGRLFGLTKQQIDRKIDEWGIDLSHLLDKQFTTLSGGQKQSVVVLRGFLHNPKVVFLDEVTKGLDPPTAIMLRKHLKHYCKKYNIAVLLTSHILQDVEILADRISFIQDGQILLSETPQNLKNHLGANSFIDVDTEELTQPIIDQITADPSILYSEQHEENVISFAVQNMYDGLEALIAVLKERNIITSFSPRSPSIEDVFMRLGDPSFQSLLEVN